MIYLILVIVSSTCNHLLFKAFARYRIELLSAIVANFAACVFIGYGSTHGPALRISLFAQDWYLFSILQGCVFVACMFLMGRTTEKQGVAVASLATRLSVALPTLTAFLLYNDLLTLTKIIGILAALLALYLSCADPRSGKDKPLKVKSALPLTLFAVFGAYSILIKFVQQKYLDNNSCHAYVMSSFLWAFLISGSVLVWRSLKTKQGWHLKDLIWGLVLGCTNYGSVYFLIKALGVPGWQSSQLFPTISIAVVALSSFGAWSLFREQIHQRKLVALAIGVVSIILINIR